MCGIIGIVGKDGGFTSAGLMPDDADQTVGALLARSLATAAQALAATAMAHPARLLPCEVISRRQFSAPIRPILRTSIAAWSARFARRSPSDSRSQRRRSWFRRRRFP